MCNLSSKIRYDLLLNDEMYDTKPFIQKLPVLGQVLVCQGYPGGPEFQAIEKFFVHASAFQCLQALLMLLLINKKVYLSNVVTNILNIIYNLCMFSVSILKYLFHVVYSLEA